MKSTCSCERTLDEAIEHALEVSRGDSSCAKQHAQLAHWLSEYRDMLLFQERIPHADRSSAQSQSSNGHHY